MYRECRDSQAGGNILLMQYSVGRDPRSQLCRELMTLLRISFRHQDYEFVATVPGDDVGTAAVLFQDTRHTLQHNIAVQVAIEIVDELEPVQIHQDHGERPARASRAFPFARKRFHKETVRLHSSQAVGYGLFLRLLEGIGIVESA